MSAAAIDPASATKPVPRGRIVAWGLWDWGSAAFNAVILTFVFSVYLTDAVGDDLPGDISANTWFGWSLGIAGFFVAVLAPVTGQRADAGGRRKLSLGVWTGLTVLSMVGAVLRQERLPLPVARPGAAAASGRSSSSSPPSPTTRCCTRCRRRRTSAGSPASAGRWAISAASCCC